MPKLERHYTEKISLHLTADQQQKLYAYAQAHGCTTSDLLRRLIDDLDMYVEIPQPIQEKLRKVAAGQRGQTAGNVIAGVLKRVYGKWGWH